MVNLEFDLDDVNAKCKIVVCDFFVSIAFMH